MQLPSANCLHNSISSFDLIPVCPFDRALDELNELIVLRELWEEVVPDEIDCGLVPGLAVNDRGTGFLGKSIL